MKKTIIKATCISALLLSTQGWCGNTSVDLRFGHNTRSDVNDSRIKVMHQANNGFYFSVEAAQNHNDTFFGDTDRYNPDDKGGNDSNLLIVFYVQIMPDDLVMQLHRF